MNEEQAVLDFFSRAENLPLALSVADQVDQLRREMNNRLWRALQASVSKIVGGHDLDWQVDLTEDRNAPDVVVGVHCSISPEQGAYLRPMAEQQYLGREWRIYCGLMWSVAPTRDHLALPAVADLRDSLLTSGFSTNSGFLAWKWSPHHPLRRDFLLRFAREPDVVVEELGEPFKELLLEKGDLLMQANHALRSVPQSVAISLEQLRNRSGGVT